MGRIQVEEVALAFVAQWRGDQAATAEASAEIGVWRVWHGTTARSWNIALSRGSGIAPSGHSEAACDLCRVLMLVPLMCTIRQRLRAQR